MIFLVLAAMVCGGLFGHAIGFDRGKTIIQRNLLSHVMESHEYEEKVVNHFIKAFNELHAK